MRLKQFIFTSAFADVSKLLVLGAAPPIFDLVTIALVVIAALAVLELFPLWLAVLSAYSR